ncbi:MAG: hypothetical protein OJF49_002448 [Ktedonobacterales bacterium]|jgi:hypothetical protein|nr:MAG: hypothetical protein OJF49_002448 [Ktedonobacterales bacterium]
MDLLVRARGRIFTAGALTLALTLAIVAAGVAAASPKLTASRPATTAVTLLQLSSDPYTNTTSQHMTEVEPDSFASGTTQVDAFQVGRFFNGGASNVGWATTTDSGATWQHGFLPGTTVFATPAGPWDRVSDPAVAFDKKHGAWLISALSLLGGRGAGVLVSRSTNGGTAWDNPVTVSVIGKNGFFDKEWVVCDNISSSPFYGNCYVEWDNAARGDRVLMSTSHDGGLTWSAPLHPENAQGLGGQPLVQPDGTVIVPFENNGGNISAFTSTTGGTSWTPALNVAKAHVNTDGGNLRSGPLPSAEIDGAGKVYLVWEDCRFESPCNGSVGPNDIVMSTSTDGVTWSAVQRIPIDPVGSGTDHFIPGIGVDTSTSGASAHIGLTFYYYPVATCDTSTCALDVGYVSSTNGGATWSAKTQLAGPMSVTWLANTSGGLMVGDYISTSILGGVAYPVFAVAAAPTNGVFDEAMFTVQGGLPVTGGANAASSAGAANSTNSTTPVKLTAY